MSDGLRSSESKDSHSAKSPFDDMNHDVQPLVQRVGYGDVAPLAQNMKPVNPNMNENPNQNGSDGAKQWRAGFGGAVQTSDVPGRTVIQGNTPGSSPHR